MNDAAGRDRFLKYLAYVLMGALFLFLFKISWLKWGNLFTDTFRDPWMVEEIFHGKVVYRDLYYEYGFLPPYLLAGLCAIFGYHLNVFIFCGAALTIGCSVLIYRTLRLFIVRFAATLAVCIFLVVFAFGQYYYQTIFNFILPYGFASIFFVLFSLAALFGFLRFILKGKAFYAYLWVAAMVLVFLSRPIMGAFIWLGFLLPWALAAHKNCFCRAAKASAFLAAPLLIASAAYTVFLSVTQAWAGFYESIVQQVTVRSAGMDTGYALRSMGLDYAGFNLLLVIATFAVVMGCVTLLAFAVSFFTKRNLFVLGLLCFAAAVIVGMFFLMNMDQYRHLPLLAAALAFWCAYRAVVSGDSTRYIALCAVFSLGFFMALRIVLNAKPAGGGFCFLTGALIGYYIFLFRLLNDFFRAKIKNFSPVKFNFSLAVFFIFINSFYPIVSWTFLLKHTVPVTGRRGGIIATDDRTSRVFQETVDYLRDHTDENATVTAVPEIGGINFFSQRRNILRYYAPTCSFLALCTEEKMVAEFAAKNPDYIVMLLSREPRYGFFGVDYGIRLSSWINDHYRLEKKCSGGLMILKKKGG